MKTVCDVEKSVTSSIPRIEEVFSICEARMKWFKLKILTITFDVLKLIL